MTSELVVRRGFPIEQRAKLWQWLNSPREPNFDDYGPRSQAEFFQQLEYRLKRERTYGIWFQDSLVGYFAFSPHTPVSGQFHGLVIAPRHRGVGIGSTAVQLVIDDLRLDGFEKFITWTFADNAPIERLFTRLGFAQEGYITGATRRDGQPLDSRILSLPGKEN